MSAARLASEYARFQADHMAGRMGVDQFVARLREWCGRVRAAGFDPALLSLAE